MNNQEEIKKSTNEIKKDERKMKNKIYYETHKNILQSKYQQIVRCVLCDASICRGSLTTHMKSSLCLKKQKIKIAVNSINNEIENNKIKLSIE